MFVATSAAGPGTAWLLQRSGDVRVSDTLYVGQYNSTERGLYEIRSGTLEAGTIGLYGHSAASTKLLQSGGSVRTGTLSISAAGDYQMLGGRLEVDQRFSSEGTMTFGEGAEEFSFGPGAWADFRKGLLVDPQNVAVSLAANSIALFPTGTDPQTLFGGYNNAGVTYIAGSTFHVPAGMEISVYSLIEDPAIIEGSLIRASGFGKSLEIRGGNVDLRSALHTVDDTVSGLFDSGLFKAQRLTIGKAVAGAKFTQTGGDAVFSYRLEVGASADGEYELSGGSLSGGKLTLAGYDNTCKATFRQTGGSVSFDSVSLAPSYYAAASYSISGGSLTTADLRIGYGAVSFQQTGGHVTAGKVLLSQVYGGDALYKLTDGELDSQELTIGGGVLQQDGGVSRIASLIFNSTTRGRYVLNGGTLEAQKAGAGVFAQFGGTSHFGELAVKNSVALAAGEMTSELTKVGDATAAKFSQTGGRHTARRMQISTGGTYALTGGELVVQQGLVLDSGGKLDLGGQPWSLNQERFLLDYRGGQVVNAANASVQLGENSLLMVPDASFDGSALFGTFSSEALVHVRGTTLAVPADRDVGGSGDISDLSIVEGRLAASDGGVLNLLAGLEVKPGGRVDLGAGAVTTPSGAVSYNEGETKVAELKGSVFEQRGGTLTVSQASSATLRLLGGHFVAPPRLGGAVAWYGGTIHGPDTWGATLSIGFDMALEQLLDGSVLDGKPFTSGFRLALFNGAKITHDAGLLNVSSLSVGGESSAATLALGGGDVQVSGLTLDFASSVRQAGGNVKSSWLTIGSGTYELIDGALTTGGFTLGNGGSFDQRGGHASATTLVVGSTNGDRGHVQVHGGVFSAAHSGSIVRGSMEQWGGEVSFEDFTVRSAAPGAEANLYRLAGGSLKVESELRVAGIFEQQSGTVEAGSIKVDPTSSIGSGRYLWSGGTIRTTSFVLGEDGEGELVVTAPTGEMSIDHSLMLYEHGRIRAQSEITVKMHEAGFYTYRRDEAAADDLVNVNLVVLPGEQWSKIEAASIDWGFAPEGFQHNYAFKSLVLMGSTDADQAPARLQIIDSKERMEHLEAVYVEHLVLGAGCELDLNGYNLYYGTLTDLGGTLTNNKGLLIAIPEPATLAFAAILGLSLFCRKPSAVRDHS